MTNELWTRAALGDVVEEWTVGRTPPRTNPEFFLREGGTPWVKVEDVKGGVLRETAEQLSEAGSAQMPLVRKGAVLVTTAGTIGKVAVAGRPMFCNQAVQALVFREDQVLARYGYYFLYSRRPLLQRLANGTTIPHISKRALQSIPIQYPSLPVQERMVARMRIPEILCDRAEGLRRQLEQYLLSAVLREARQAREYRPVEALLAEAPLSGLWAKASPGEEGVLLVNRLSGGLASLSGLEDFQRVRVSEKQSDRYALQPMDILLRSTDTGSGSRGALVLQLPERALAGGNLVRLRTRPSALSAWLLAWLLGPGGDSLYTGGKLQKQLLASDRIPMPERPREFAQKFLLYLELEKKAAQFSEQAQALRESVLRLVFLGSAAEESPSGDFAAGETSGELARLTEPASRFLREMSRFQQELYRTLLRSGEGQPVHVLLRQLRREPETAGGTGGIQDALSAFALLEQFGLVEREIPQKIPLVPEGPEGGEQTYMTDHNGRPVLIDTYKPAEDVLEENAYAAGAGEDSEL